MRLPSTVQPEVITAIIDTREKNPVDLSPLNSERGMLVTGDYTIRGLESVIAFERKGPSDFFKSCGSDRARFQKQIDRLLAFPIKALVIESTWEIIEAGAYESQIKPASVLGSLYGWIAQGLPIVMAGDHKRAGRVISRMLFIAARRRYQEARHLLGHVTRKREATTA